MWPEVEGASGMGVGDEIEGGRGEGTGCVGSTGHCNDFGHWRDLSRRVT